MSKITLTIEGDDWADVGLGIADLWQNLNTRASQTASAPTVVPVPAQETPVAAVSDGPPGQCPKHLRPWKDGKFGPFCSAKDESQEKGYCSLTPGDIWNGKRAAA